MPPKTWIRPNSPLHKYQYIFSPPLPFCIRLKFDLAFPLPSSFPRQLPPFLFNLVSSIFLTFFHSSSLLLPPHHLNKKNYSSEKSGGRDSRGVLKQTASKWRPIPMPPLLRGCCFSPQIHQILPLCCFLRDSNLHPPPPFLFGCFSMALCSFGWGEGGWFLLHLPAIVNPSPPTPKSKSSSFLLPRHPKGSPLLYLSNWP